MDTSPSPTREQTARARRASSASAVGSLVEWYDFGLYGAAAALIFKDYFFATDDAFVGLMAAFATFAVGYFARPFGGMVFGHLGDKVGRKPVMVGTLALMGVSTTLIGLLPGYDTVGWFARSCWSCCACCRAWVPVPSTPVPSCSPLSPRRRAAGASTPPGPARACGSAPRSV